MHILNIQVKEWGGLYLYEIGHYEEPSGEFVRHVPKFRAIQGGAA
jgi:hypothetical protein